MLDSVVLWVEDSSALEIGERCFQNASEAVDLETGEVKLVGSLGNLRLKATGSGFSVTGSLCKFQNGDNLTPLSRKGVQEAIERLGDLTKAKVQAAKVYRLDIGESLVVKEPVQTYLSCLGEAPNFQRVLYPRGGLLYQNGRKSLSFYDKVKESKLKREALPEIAQGRSFLRYEVQIKKRLPDVLKVAEIKAESLYNEDFYIGLVQLWKGEYFGIQRVSKLRIKPDMIDLNVKNLERQLACIALKQVGEGEFLSLIESAKQKGQLERYQAKRLKDKIKELANLPDLTEP
ncbi:MAG: hypothetical protein HGB11_01710, partial [Chlorobiales bacterium]|nr:hypothetical protein [Chlorobiales bacterium]